MLADDRRVRPGGQMHQGGLSVVVLVTAQHRGPLPGDLVLIEIAAPWHQGLLSGMDQGRTGRRKLFLQGPHTAPASRSSASRLGKTWLDASCDRARKVS